MHSLRSCLAILVVIIASRATAEQAYWVVFTGPPAVEAYQQALQRGEKAAVASAQAQVAANGEEQSRALSANKGIPPIRELFRVQRVLNAVAIRTDAGNIEALRALPGVRRVTPLTPVRLANATSVPFIGAPELWSAPVSALGRGVTIGIIDTGIDYIHPDFGGDGNNATYDRNDNLRIGDVEFPTRKVVGGYDFVGDAYNLGKDETNVPIPDPDPMDQIGHGTHVAGTAAGFGVTDLGVPYQGPYGTSSPFLQMDIGPGVAPAALLFALKVFGTGGETEILAPAIEWSVDPNGDGNFSDHLDVINLSLGEEYGRSTSPLSLAIENATAAGVIVVSSAGNDGEPYCSVGAPGSAVSAISVAAFEHENPAQNALDPRHLANYSSRGPAIYHYDQVYPKPDIAAPGSYIVSAAVGPFANGIDRRTLSGTSMASPHVAGAAALAREAHRTWSVAEIKAQLMNSALPSLFTYRPNVSGEWPVPQSRGGAGQVAVSAYGTTNVIVFASDDPSGVWLSFGARDVDVPTSFSVSATLKNFSLLEQSFQVEMVPANEVAGAQVSLDAETITVAPEGTATLTLRLDVDPSRLQQPRDPSALISYGEFYRHFLTEVSGALRFTPLGASQPMALPYYACLRPVAALTPRLPVLHADALPAAIGFDGTPLDIGGDFPVHSMVSPLTLLYRSPRLPESGEDAVADLDMIGASLSCLEDGTLPADTYLNIGISTHAPWTTPASLRFLVYIDTNLDGNVDYVLRNNNTRIGLGGARLSDAFSAELTDTRNNVLAVLPINGIYADGPDGANTALLRNNVMALPVRLADLKLAEGTEFIQFIVQTVIDPVPVASSYVFVDAAPEQDFSLGITKWFRVSVRRPGLGFPQEDSLPPHPRVAVSGIPVLFDATSYYAEGIFNLDGSQQSPPLGALYLQHHAPFGTRAQWVPLLGPGATDSDGDGIVDEVEGAEDEDRDGLPNHLDFDSDGDGVSDAYEGGEDADHDGLPNFLDQDSDNDSLGDHYEFTTGVSDPYRADSDDDAIPDGVEGDGDPDGDGIPNARDNDSDGDGLSDAIEGIADPDYDAVPAYLDLDSDSDGLPDRAEGADDVERDHLPNFLDTDSDGDGIDDATEIEIGTAPYVRDTDADGVLDGAELTAGRDPLVMDAPAPPATLTVVSQDCEVLANWSVVPGATAYRVYRARMVPGGVTNFSDATPLGDWTDSLTFADVTAELSRPALRRGCTVEPARVFIYAYFVQARNAGGESVPSGPVLAQRRCP